MLCFAILQQLCFQAACYTAEANRYTGTRVHRYTGKQEASSQIQEIKVSEAEGRNITLLENVQNRGAESRSPSREEEHSCDGEGSTSSRPSHSVS